VDASASQSEIGFSTDALPASERLPYLRDVVGRFAKFDLRPLDHPLRYSFRIRLLDGLVIVSGETSGISASRSRSLLADGDDDLVFTTNRSGFSLVSQVGRECRLDAGSAALLASAEAGAQIFPGSVTHLTLHIPRQRLAILVGTPEDALIRPIPASSEPLRLLIDYVDMALRGHQLASAELRHAFAIHVYDLVALAIGATRDAAEVTRGRGLGAARLNAAKGDILRCLDDSDLTVIDVAGRLGVTARYLQKLFESEGTTFSEYVTRQRLASAHRMLCDPRFLDRSIITIAFDVGFANLSHFNRLFRRAYGGTPSDVRASARATARRD
jgi:AraC-like DNA-binding protein